MQKLIQTLLVGALMALASMTFTGCGSTPEATATKVAGTQVLTVDGAMKAWAEWVNAGHATQAQVETVREAYMKYYIAAQAEKSALAAYANAKAANTNAVPATSVDWNAAVTALTAAESDLLKLIVQLKGK